MIAPNRRLRLATFLGLVSALLLLDASSALAQEEEAPAGGVLDVTISRRGKYPIAIPVGVEGTSSTNREIAAVASNNMRLAGWAKVLDPDAFLADVRSEGLGIELDKWKDIGAFAVMKYRSSGSGKNVRVEFRLYEIEKGSEPVLSRSYSGDDARSLTHRWCNAVVKHLTGQPGFFGSKIAFTARIRRGKQRYSTIMVMDHDGFGMGSVTPTKTINILPAFSPSGGQIAFTSYMRNNPDLYVIGAGGGKPRRVSKRYGMNTGAAWSPDGSKIALTLSKDGNPDIYVISASSGQILRRLTDSRFIDTSPAWSPDGKEIAYVSDSQGGPQIFVMSANGGGGKRVSFNGDYNTTPTWMPVKGRRVLAYTTRDTGNFDVVTLDLASGAYTRITQNEGNNEEPAFAPNGHAIAFARSSGPGGAGIYIANADGTGDAIKIKSGAATSVDWGPLPSQD